MPVIKAPYNFVPFNKQVVTPHWVDQISHDIPFKDGLSGKIEVKLTAMSPIFVRDGVGQDSAKAFKNDHGEQVKAYTFSQAPDGRYFIPGTSLKGMIRSVLEILSFGHMEGKVNDHRYAVRDFRNNDLYNPSQISQMVKCGWLQKVGGEYLLADCGKPGRISHKHLGEAFKIDISEFFQKKQNDKSALLKYKRYSKVLDEQMFETWEDSHGKLRCKPSEEGSLQGKIVFTGQPSERRQRKNQPGKWEGKHLEFVFPETGSEAKPVPEKVIDNFFFACYDHDTAKQSPDWKYWKPKLDQGEKVPVFFRQEGGMIKDMGLSMLYKIAYENSVLDAIRHYQKENKPDLSEAIFGHVWDGKEQLRGRVHIGHAFSQNATPTQAVTEVLSGPKASYYPTYIRQNVNEAGRVNGSYQTFMNQQPEIAGWKRYPVHAQGVKKNPAPDGTDSKKITTTFIPLNKGTEFTFTIRYHNLRPIELGSLLSALTFHGSDNVFHSLGMGKPLGYGKLKAEITKSDHDLKKALSDFECYMNAVSTNGQQPWHQSKQVVELITMAREQFNNKEEEEKVLDYMALQEHIDAKRDKEALPLYSQLVKSDTQVHTFCDEDGIQAMRHMINTESNQASHSTNIEEVISNKRGATRREVEFKFPRWRQDLINQLAEIQAIKAGQERVQSLQQLENEVIRKKITKQEEYKKKGPDIDSVSPSTGKAFSSLAKKIEDFGRAYYDQNDKQLKELHPNGYLPDKFRKKLWDWLDQYVGPNGGLGVKARSKWIKDGIKKGDLKSLAYWVGDKEALDFLNQLKKHN